MINKKILHDYSRFNVPNFIQKDNLIGIELGVANGDFSKKMLESNKFKLYYGVDKYSDHHDSMEYLAALKHIGINKSFHLLRTSFESALNIFEDNYFDFVYVDGYAHGGQEGGKTLCDWIKKVKVGGIICGDDYDSKFPLTIKAVNHLAQNTNNQIYLTNKDFVYENQHKHFASWIIKVDKEYNVKPDKSLILKSKIISEYHKIRIKIKYLFK
tara:strand:+ start:75 stop:713 length:639 start_codon:yes stop_codon:yes gene_type:complete